MQVKCKTDVSADIGLYMPFDSTKKMYTDEDIVFGDEISETLGPELSKYALTIGNIYTVYGCITFNGVLRYLIQDDRLFAPAFSLQSFSVYSMQTLA